MKPMYCSISTHGDEMRATYQCGLFLVLTRETAEFNRCFTFVSRVSMLYETTNHIRERPRNFT